MNTLKVVLIVFVAVFMHFHWNYQLSFILNIVGIAERAVSTIFPIEHYGDDSFQFLANYRKAYENLPLPIRFPGTVEIRDIEIMDFAVSDFDGETEVGHYLLHSKRSIKFQIYRPREIYPHESLPVIIYLHGGGFVFGGFQSHAHINSELAKQTGFIVIAVDYRLAPENKFPAAHLDCLASIRYISEHADEFNVDKKRIVVAGDSAGGNLATVMSQHLPHLIKYQVIMYPCLPSYSLLSLSYIENKNSIMLSTTRMLWFYHRYFKDFTELYSPLACPFQFKGNWSSIPPAMIITAEYDILRDEGELYAEKLKSEGVPVSAIRYNNTVHAFAGVMWFTHGSLVISDISRQLLEVI